MKTLVISFLYCISSFSLAFTQAHLVQDINPSSGFGGEGSNGFEGVLYNGWYYFGGNDAIHGFELWKTNGDTAILAFDLTPGNTLSGMPKDSHPARFIEYNSKLYFISIKNGIDTQLRLWEYDGISQPHEVNWFTFPASNSIPWSYLNNLEVFNGKLIVGYSDSTNNLLVEFDGINVSYINSSATSFKHLKSINNKLYAIASCDTCSTLKLWEYDGISMAMVPNVNMSKNLNYGPIDIAIEGKHFALFQNKLFFTAFDSIHGFETWQYDGVTASLAFETNIGTGNGSRGNYIVYNNKLVYSGFNNIFGHEIWEYDGLSTSLIQNLNPVTFALSGGLEWFEIFDNELYFDHSDNGVNNFDLWKYNGSNISLVAELHPPNGTNSFPVLSGLKTAGPYMYFTASDSIYGTELRRVESCNIQNASVQTIEACQSYTSPSGLVYDQSAYFKDTIPNSCGGDSILTINLTVIPLDNSITQVNNILTANQNQILYQWMECTNNNYILIQGAVNQQFAVPSNGNYAVILHDPQSGCLDTSDCISIADLNIKNENGLELRLYPNPSQGSFYIETDGLNNIDVLAYNLLGQVIQLNEQIDNDRLRISFPVNFKGVAFLKIQTSGGIETKKIEIR